MTYMALYRDVPVLTQEAMYCVQLITKIMYKVSALVRLPYFGSYFTIFIKVTSLASGRSRDVTQMILDK